MTNQPLSSDLAVLLDHVDNLIIEAPRLLWTGRILVDSNELATLLSQIRHALPEEVRQAQWVIAERDRVLQEAADQAEAMKLEAEASVLRQAESSEVVQRARDRALELTEQARQAAREIHQGARTYADDVLARLESEVHQVLEDLKANRAELRNEKA